LEHKLTLHLVSILIWLQVVTETITPYWRLISCNNLRYDQNKIHIRDLEHLSGLSEIRKNKWFEEYDKKHNNELSETLGKINKCENSHISKFTMYIADMYQRKARNIYPIEEFTLTQNSNLAFCMLKEKSNFKTWVFGDLANFIFWHSLQIFRIKRRTLVL